MIYSIYLAGSLSVPVGTHLELFYLVNLFLCKCRCFTEGHCLNECVCSASTFGKQVTWDLWLETTNEPFPTHAHSLIFFSKHLAPFIHALQRIARDSDQEFLHIRLFTHSAHGRRHLFFWSTLLSNNYSRNLYSSAYMPVIKTRDAMPNESVEFTGDSSENRTREQCWTLYGPNYISQ